MNTYRRIHVFIGNPIDPMAESIMEELSELTDKNEYKKIIDKITQELEKEFLELKEEAAIFAISDKSVQSEKSSRPNKPARVQKPGILNAGNSKTGDVEIRAAIAKNSITGQLKTEPDFEILDNIELTGFDEDKELIVNPANAE